jgi:hypothetical protein
LKSTAVRGSEHEGNFHLKKYKVDEPEKFNWRQLQVKQIIEALNNQPKIDPCRPSSRWPVLCHPRGI